MNILNIRSLCFYKGSSWIDVYKWAILVLPVRKVCKIVTSRGAAKKINSFEM